MSTIREILKIKPEAEIKLPEGFKTKWIEALESGNYSQTNGLLYRPIENSNGPMGFCCLGVAANVCEIGLNRLNNQPMPNDLPQRFKNRLPKVLFTPEGAQIQEQLAKFNDGVLVEGYTKKYNFLQIARWIQKYL